MKRRVFSSLSLLILLAIIAFNVATWLTRPTPGVALENAHRIRFGMTLEEVEQVFGEQGKGVNGGGFGVAFVRSWKSGNLEVEVIFCYGTLDPNSRDAGAGSLIYHFEGQGEMWDGIDLLDDDHDHFPARMRRLLAQWL